MELARTQSAVAGARTPGNTNAADGTGAGTPGTTCANYTISGVCAQPKGHVRSKRALELAPLLRHLSRHVTCNHDSTAEHDGAPQSRTCSASNTTHPRRRASQHGLLMWRCTLVVRTSNRAHTHARAHTHTHLAACAACAATTAHEAPPRTARPHTQQSHNRAVTVCAIGAPTHQRTRPNTAATDTTQPPPSPP